MNDGIGGVGGEEREIRGSPIGRLLHLDEHTPLLIGGPEAARQDAEGLAEGKERLTAKGMMKDSGFWSFGILLALCLGPVRLYSFLIAIALRLLHLLFIRTLSFSASGENSSC